MSVRLKDLSVPELELASDTLMGVARGYREDSETMRGPSSLSARAIVITKAEQLERVSQYLHETAERKYISAA